jgi:hypothetical protein
MQPGVRSRIPPDRFEFLRAAVEHHDAVTRPVVRAPDWRASDVVAAISVDEDSLV